MRSILAFIDGLMPSVLVAKSRVESMTERDVIGIYGGQ
jgi:hypothetical protein